MQAPDELVAAAGTYCILCTTRTTPKGGHEAISLVDATTGTTLGTWTTATTSKAVGIVWTYTMSPAGVVFVLDPNSTDGVVWTGPASLFVAVNDVVGNKVGMQASFSGSADLAASVSTEAVVTL